MSGRYVVRRLLQLVPTVAAIVVVGFLLVHASPGDPVTALAGEDGSAEYYAAARAKYGLDRPLVAQFATYASNVVRGDLGTSIVHGRPVMAIIFDRLPATLLLMVTSMVISTIAGVLIGVFSARRRGSIADLFVNITTLTAFAAPVYWVGQLAILGFAFRLDIFPVQGMSSARSDATGLSHAIDVGYHLILPALVLASQQVASVARLARTALIEELNQDHIRMARAKGLSDRRVVWAHGLRRALLPVATVVGGRLGHIVSGTVIVEIVFSWPGIGRLLFNSIQTLDQPLLLGLFMLVAATVVVANLLTDLAYAWLDPRIQYA